MYYREAGSALKCPLVFIHGFPLNHTMWNPQLETLPEGVRAVAYDVRGHGNSSVGDGQFSLEFLLTI